METEEVGFFAIDALPELSLKRVTPQQIERLTKLAADHCESADFD
jgi:hypothetical protein